jgi:hypothetical protein
MHEKLQGRRLLPAPGNSRLGTNALKFRV